MLEHYKYDASRTLPKRAECAARMLANTRQRVSVSDIASHCGVTERSARGYIEDPRVHDRVWYLQRFRVKAAVAKALGTLEELLDSDNDAVRLRAASEVLDRAGFVAEEKTEEKQTFNVVLNLGSSEGALKTATFPGPPPTNGEFLPAGESPVLPDLSKVEGEEIEPEADSEEGQSS